MIQKEAMTKNLILMAREIEKLRGEHMRTCGLGGGGYGVMSGSPVMRYSGGGYGDVFDGIGALRITKDLHVIALLGQSLMAHWLIAVFWKSRKIHHEADVVHATKSYRYGVPNGCYLVHAGAEHPM
nr:hypothetical protein [Tanacetum cinerariifolium]